MSSEVLLSIKGTVHQMYECISDVLLHLDRMLGIFFMVQRRQIWPKNEEKKRVLTKFTPASFEECPCGADGHSSKDAGVLLKGHGLHFVRFLAIFDVSEP